VAVEEPEEPQETGGTVRKTNKKERMEKGSGAGVGWSEIRSAKGRSERQVLEIES